VHRAAQPFGPRETWNKLSYTRGTAQRTRTPSAQTHRKGDIALQNLFEV
jgi:hypothetical protein